MTLRLDLKSVCSHLFLRTYVNDFKFFVNAMNNNSGSYSRSTKMFAASHPVPLGHNINNNHDNRNLSLNNNSDNRSNDNKTWGVPHGSNLNNVTHQNFHSQHQQFHTPGQQRHRNNNVGSERNIDEYNSNGHTFSKTPFGPRGNMVGNPSDHRQNANELGPPNKNTTFHRTPGAAASFPSRGSGSNRGWSSYDGRDQGTSGNNIRQNGLVSIARSLKNNTYLNELNIQWIHIL